jgi:hypothetical protein
MRRLVLLALFVLVLIGVAYGYSVNHDRLWNSGPIIDVFHATDSPDRENSVGITSQVRELIPDGSAQTAVEGMLATDGFACEAAREAGEISCRREPFGLFCKEHWFVFYALREGETVDITHASKQLKCL